MEHQALVAMQVLCSYLAATIGNGIPFIFALNADFILLYLKTVKIFYKKLL